MENEITRSRPAGIDAFPAGLVFDGCAAAPRSARRPRADCDTCAHDDTKYVNVEGGEVVKFVIGGPTFGWDFDGAGTVEAFDLNRVAPAGILDHKVTAYVSPNPSYAD